jgi:tetratricopeptide (TPR) repeat protein
LSFVAVVCPGCKKHQEVGVGASAPAEGLRTACAFCGTAIIVGADASAAQSARTRTSRGRPAIDLAMTDGGSADLPAARESVPRPSIAADDPSPLIDLGLPDDLMMARDLGLPEDLMAPRDTGLPGDLMVAREDLPRLDDLMTNEVASPGGPRPSPPPGVELMDPLDINQPVALAGPAARWPETAAGLASSIPLGIDIFIGELPSGTGSPLAPLELDLNPEVLEPPPLVAEAPALTPLLSTSPRAPSPPPMPLAPSKPAPATPGLGALKMPPRTGPPARGFTLPPPAPAPPIELDVGGSLDMAAMLSGLLEDAPTPAALARKAPLPPAPAPRAPAPAPEPPAAAGGDVSFRLTIDTPVSSGQEPVAGARPLPPAVTRPAAPAGRIREYVLPTGVAALAPPRRKSTALVEDAPARRPRMRKVVVAGVAGVLVLAAAGLFLVPLFKGGPRYVRALAPFEADLARDHYPAYQGAAEAILAAAGEKPTAEERAAAAELLLLSVLGRGGEKAKLRRVEQLLADLSAADEARPLVRRAQALLALARGKGSQAEQLLGSEAGSPEAQLMGGLRRLRERKPELALLPLRRLADSAANRVLPRYLLGLALEQSRQGPLAAKAFERVLGQNPEHAGALVGKERLRTGPHEERRAAAEALARKIAGKASPGELGEAWTLQGETTLALGRSAEAVEVLSRAVAASPQNAASQAALAEALIAEGRPSDALGRLRSAEASVQAALPARIALAAALIASGQIAEGTIQIESLGPAASDNPRVAYWMGVAAERQRPPDLENAARRYLESLAADRRFLPASLRLAALLQKQGKPDKALALIKEAENAGVAPEALELAWGQALIAARNPAEAEAVFRKATARSPSLVAARVGLASALEEGGKLDEAEDELQRAVSELKVAGLRDRLADLLLKRGKKQEALAAFEAELASGNNDHSVRVRLAKLALDLGKLDRAAVELEAVVGDSPGTPEAYFTLGRVREAAGDLPRALRDYRSALLYESHPQLHLALGRTLAALGKEDDALVHLGSAGELAAARLELARIRMRRNRIDEALIDAEAAARLAPGDGQAHFILGLCLDLQGRSADAAIAWRAALKVSPQLSEAHYRVGRHEMDKGHPAAAIAHFRQAAERRPAGVTWEADLYFQLGLAELTAGSKSAAAAALRRYLEVAAPDAPTRPEAERMLARLGRN